MYKPPSYEKVAAYVDAQSIPYKPGLVGSTRRNDIRLDLDSRPTELCTHYIAGPGNQPYWPDEQSHQDKCPGTNPSRQYVAISNGKKAIRFEVKEINPLNTPILCFSLSFSSL